MDKLGMMILTLASVGIVSISGSNDVLAQTNAESGMAAWTVALTVTADGIILTRTFGGDPNATDGYDSGLDVVGAPPGMTYYAYFEIPLFPNFLITDIRRWVSPYDQSIDWTLKIVNATGKTSVVSWNPSALPAEGRFSLEVSIDTVDMRIQNSISLTGDQVLAIKYRPVERKKGDVNGDGRLNILDVVLMVKIILGQYSPNPEESWAADCNNDGVINILDAILLISWILNPPSFGRDLGR